MLSLRPALFLAANLTLALASMNACGGSEADAIDPTNGQGTNPTLPAPATDAGKDSAKEKEEADAKDASSKDATPDAKKKDASNEPEPSDGGPYNCVGQGGSGSGGPNSCMSSSTYLCKGDTREIECSCPEAKCTCKVNGVVTTTFPSSQCPSCGVTKSDYEHCGIFTSSGGTSGGTSGTSGMGSSSGGSSSGGP